MALQALNLPYPPPASVYPQPLLQLQIVRHHLTSEVKSLMWVKTFSEARTHLHTVLGKPELLMILVGPSPKADAYLGSLILHGQEAEKTEEVREEPSGLSLCLEDLYFHHPDRPQKWSLTTIVCGHSHSPSQTRYSTEADCHLYPSFHQYSHDSVGRRVAFFRRTDGLP